MKLRTEMSEKKEDEEDKGNILQKGGNEARGILDSGGLGIILGSYKQRPTISFIYLLLA